VLKKGEKRGQSYNLLSILSGGNPVLFIEISTPLGIRGDNAARDLVLKAHAY